MPERISGFQYDDYGNTCAIKVSARGIDAMRNNYINKASAFTEAERRDLGLYGMLPPAVRSLDLQTRNSIQKVERKQDDVEKFIFIRSLFDRSVTLAHALIKSNIEEYMNIIYTPTVGIACQQYSSMFRTAHGIHFYPGNIDDAEKILRGFAHRNIRVAVVTDNQGILGIGDQGAGGIAICLGKLMLYTQGAGIAPWHCLPISLDVGTDNAALLEDQNYLGWRHRRIKGDEYMSFVKRFARAFKAVFPNALCQWEDFSQQTAFDVRDAYLDELISFNDDIQGTGAVALSAVMAATKIKEEPLEDQVFLIYGAGAGGIGVAEQIEAGLMARGLSERDALDRIFTLDRMGLVTSTNFERDYQKKHARNPQTLPWFREHKDGTLINVIKKARVTVMIGTSGQTGHFTQEAVEAMLTNSDRPVILPLSNPTERCEATPEQIIHWTSGRALIATGSPFAPVKYGGKSIKTGQCNNVFIFPGVGLGVLASGAKKVLPAFFAAAAKAVADAVPTEDLRDGVLLPPVESIREVSQEVALAVGLAAIGANVSGPCAFSSFQHNNEEHRLERLIEKMQWQPQYLPLLAVTDG
jgi:malate dehydrogenase (oxaloacetate-decarboxylating)